MSDNPDGEGRPALVDIRAMSPEPAVSYELVPGRFYLIQIRVDDERHDGYGEHVLVRFERLLRARGVSAVVISGDFDVSIFELSTKQGAAIIPKGDARVFAGSDVVERKSDDGRVDEG